jgi:hypothetical protein
MSRGPEQFLLPFAEREYISVQRTARILGIGYSTVFDLHRARRIEMIDYRHHAPKRVKYSSVVAFCDFLRAQYSIPDRRPPLSYSFLRHKDEELLPFPMSDTMYVKEAREYLGFDSFQSVRNLLEQAYFEGYKISPSSTWRISRTSFTAFVEKSHGPKAVLALGNRFAGRAKDINYEHPSVGDG